MKKARLYVIIDNTAAADADLTALAADIAAAGADFIQYRDKLSPDNAFVRNAQKIRKAIAGRARFIINDRLHTVAEIGADGVHLGQNDAGPGMARRSLGPNATIGATANTLAQARAAWGAGANYIGMGAVFATATKQNPLPLSLDELQEARVAASVPVFAIGGINIENIGLLTSRGITDICLCSAIIRAKEGAGAATRIFREILDNAAKAQKS